MLKNKIIVKRIRNIFILLMAMIIMLGAYRNIRRSLADDVIDVTMEVTDKTGELVMQSVMLDATKTATGKYEIELPPAISGNIVTKYYTPEGEEIPIQLDTEAIKLELTSEEVKAKKLQMQSDFDTKDVVYSKDGVETTKKLYNKLWKYSDEMVVTGYMPLETEMKVNEIDEAT